MSTTTSSRNNERRRPVFGFDFRALARAVALLWAIVLAGCSSPQESPAACLGAAACACYPNGTCDGLLVCSETGLCGARANCAPGTRDCTCADAGACLGTDVACRAGTCVSTVGEVGAACFANRTCVGDAQCVNETCVTCTVGTEGCPCRSDKTCASTNLGCDPRASRCVRADLIDDQPPAMATRCFTPCRADLTGDGGVIARCGADGLIEGCLPGATCVQGTCARADAGVAAAAGVSCTGPTDCPAFQTCVAGTCASTCDYDSDCGGVRRCHLHVCREPCDSTVTACSAQNGQSVACSIVDGTRGFCMPTVPPSGAAQTAVSASFSLDEAAFRLTNRAPTARIRVRNDGLQSIAFTLRKREHREPGSSGADTILVDAPSASPPVFAMPFIQMAVDGRPLQAGSSITSARVVPGATVEFTVDATNGNTPAQWEGVLEVSSDGGVQSVRISYASSLDGRWAGTVHLFSRFDTSVTPANAVQGDDSLAAVLRRSWTAPEPSSGTTQANNALVARWRLFVRDVATGGGTSTFSLSEWDAVVSATVTESWNQPQAVGCGAPACYLTLATGSGLQQLSADRRLVPTGAIELPFAVDLAAIGPAFAGAVDSNVALDFPGSPAVNLQLESSDFTRGSLSLRRVTSLTARSILGARTVLTDASSSCSNDSAESLQPWLVDAFAGRSARKARARCENAATNPAPSGATPRAIEASPTHSPSRTAAVDSGPSSSSTAPS